MTRVLSMEDSSAMLDLNKMSQGQIKNNFEEHWEFKVPKGFEIFFKDNSFLVVQNP